MNLNIQKEDFSKAYVYALAAQSGWTVGSWSQDPFKIDTSLKKLVKMSDGFEEVLQIDFQLKCTEQPTTDNKDFISFTLKKEDFEALSKRKGGKPLLLCVLVVPNKLDEWIKLVDSSAEEIHRSTCLKHCGYLAFISDEAGNYLENDKTIRFQKNSHVFDENALKQIESKLMDREYRRGNLQREMARLENQNDA